MIRRTKTDSTLYSLVIFCVLLFSVSCESDNVTYSQPLVEGDRVIIDTGLLDNKRPEFFSMTVNGNKVTFFVVKINDSVESYIDACQNCYLFKKGFKVKGSYIICRHCSSEYPIDTLKEGLTSCHPMPLKGELKGEKYHISLKEIKKAAKYF